MGAILCTHQFERILTTTIFKGPPGIMRGFDSSSTFITEWANKSDDIMWDVLLANTGQLTVSIAISNEENHGDYTVEVQIGEKILPLHVSSECYYKKSTTVDLGFVNIEHSGHYTVRLRAKESKDDSVGKLYFVELGGPASKGIKNKTIFNIKPCAVKLQWTVGHHKADMLYNEVLVNRRDSGVIVVFGLHRVQVSLYSKGINICVKDDIPTKKKSKTKVTQNAYIVQHSRTASALGFKGHSELNCYEPYDWKPGHCYQFLLKAKEYEMDKSMIYSVHFKESERDSWRMIVILKLCNYQELIGDVSSSIEQCEEYHGHNMYEAHFGPMWRHGRECGWIQITQAKFSRKGEGWQSDINAGVTKDQRFFLATGGCIEQKTKLNTNIFCEKSDNLPKCLSDLNSDTNILLDNN